MLFPGRHAQAAREAPRQDGEQTAVSRQGRWAAWGEVLVLGGQAKEEQVFRGIESGTKASVNAGEIWPVKTKVSSLNVKIFIDKKKKKKKELLTWRKMLSELGWEELWDEREFYRDTGEQWISQMEAVDSHRKFSAIITPLFCSHLPKWSLHRTHKEAALNKLYQQWLDGFTDLVLALH